MLVYETGKLTPPPQCKWVGAKVTGLTISVLPHTHTHIHICMRNHMVCTPMHAKVRLFLYENVSLC